MGMFRMVPGLFPTVSILDLSDFVNQPQRARAAASDFQDINAGQCDRWDIRCTYPYKIERIHLEAEEPTLRWYIYRNPAAAPVIGNLTTLDLDALTTTFVARHNNNVGAPGGVPLVLGTIHMEQVNWYFDAADVLQIWADNVAGGARQVSVLVQLVELPQGRITP